MSKLVVIDNGKIRPVEDIYLAEKIIDLKEKKDPWEVIDELVRTWIKRTPDEAEAVKIDVADQREMLVDKEYGTTKGGKDQERRFTVLFPTSLMLLIRTQFKADVLPFDREFYREFTKRYPVFKVAQKN